MATGKGKIRVGIAGLGRSGWNIHARLIEPLSTKYDIVAVFDKNPEKLKEAEERFKCRSYKTYKGLISDKDVELVVVAMPNHMHAKCSIQAMEAGKDVVCEKPMATSLAAAKKMVECSKKTKKLLSIFQNYRYNPDSIQVKKVIDSGVLGRIVQIKMCMHNFARRWDWQTLKKYGGGTMNNTGPHPIDMGIVLFGEGKKEPKVFCLRDKALTLGDADDHVKVIMYGKGSPTVEVEISAACAYPREKWLIMGTRGSLTGNHADINWKYFDPKKLPRRKVDESLEAAGRGYCGENIPFIEKSWNIKEFKGPEDPQVAFYSDLYDTIRKGKPLFITPESVLIQMKVLDKCRKMAPV